MTLDHAMKDPQPISVIVTAYDRESVTRETIRMLQACTPAPAEILVHFDNNAFFPLPEGVGMIKSKSNIGPGGGRNRLIEKATHAWIASFDDDSYPIHADYFARLSDAIRRHPKAGVIASVIRHRNPIHDSTPFQGERHVGSFVGCGCAYRKDAFMQTTGYVALPVAYGMEEVDLALQLHAQGVHIVEIAELEVFHDTELSHHESAKITAGSIKNQALLVFLRYPLVAFPYGILQWLNKIRDNLQRHRWAGCLRGFLEMPGHLWRYWTLRKPIPLAAFVSYRRLMRSNGRELVDVPDH